MKKTKIILSATGGVIALAVLVSAYLTWDAFSSRSDALYGNEEADEPVEGLETYARNQAQLEKKNPYPCEENRKRFEENRQRVEEWRQAAMKLGSVGDWEAEDLTPAQFKEKILTDAQNLMKEPGSADGHLLKADFGFGPFKPYLGDMLPPKAQLADLQRQWYDITSLCDLLRTNGVAQIVDVQVLERKEAPKASASAPGKAKAKAKGKAQETKPEWTPSAKTYTISFTTTKGFDLAGVIRQLAARERFTVVDKFLFTHTHDTAAETFGGSEKKEATPAATGRRGGRRRQAAVVAKAAEVPEEEKVRKAFDPEADTSLRVELTVSTYDFRTMEETK